MRVSSGAVLQPDRSCSFELWAPAIAEVELEILDPSPRRIAMRRDDRGVHRAAVGDVTVGTRYRFAAGGHIFADPASRHQPQGVHGPSAVIDPTFAWTDDKWRGRSLDTAVIYELHVGTFTRAGTLDAAIDELDRLVELGITAIELMPLAQFPGARNWGYDGAFPFAVAQAYGGPDALRRFVDACHARRLAVIVDVVYNHFGPEGSVFSGLGPYYRDDCHTPWGAALNFDGPDSDGVRSFFLDNAAMWLRTHHVDGLRLDAVHSIVDRAPITFLDELVELTRSIGAESWPRWLIAESDANDARLLRPTDRCGVGLDAVWADDFHHAVHRLLTGESGSYYADYEDRSRLVDAIEHGFAYRGEYSGFRRRRHGAPTDGLPPTAFVVCVQNHDQIGNRPHGDRLVAGVPVDAAAMAMAMLLLSPHVPLLFMGEEYGDPTPFRYFVDHGDAALIEATRAGRRSEHGFDAGADPVDPLTMASSVIDPRMREHSPHREREALVRTLLQVRQSPLFRAGRHDCHASLHADGRVLRIVHGDCGPLGLFVLDRDARGPIEVPLADGSWSVGIDSADPRWGGAARLLEPVLRGSVCIDPPAYWFAVLHRNDPP
jgi:maltooligosyltrehalose trehalohydrolase